MNTSNDRNLFRIVVLGGIAFHDRVRPLLPGTPRLVVEWRDMPAEGDDRPVAGDIIIVDAAAPAANCLALTAPGAGRVIAADIHSDIAHAVAWLKAGAAEYIALDTDGGALPRLTAAAYERWQQQADADRLAPVTGQELVGESTYVDELRQLAEKLARLPYLTVLIQGETGTGKGLLTRHIHNRSGTGGELVEINCAAIPEQLLESELFGYEAGAFTGARQRKRGLLEIAENGTILLDEIGAMPFELQSKILKCIEEKNFRRVGGARELKFQARIVACSNIELAELAARGKFRQDLFFRLNVFPIRLTPLRERPADIAPLVEHFIQYFANLYRLPVSGIEPSALNHLRALSWPGNVRELKHTVERAVILRESGRLTPQDFGVTTAAAPQQTADFHITLGPTGVRLEAAEREVISRTLELTGGNRSHAADLLAIPRSRLLRKIVRYDLQHIGRDSANETSED